MAFGENITPLVSMAVTRPLVTGRSNLTLVIPQAYAMIRAEAGECTI